MKPQSISKKFKKSDFSMSLSLDQKIDIFHDRIEGWQLDIARTCYQNIPHGGFGALYICLSYFETMARYRIGSTVHSNAGKYFKKGFKAFSARIGYDSNIHYKEVRDAMYEGARCGLYHIGMTSKRVFISSDHPDIFTYDSSIPELVINPGLLINSLLDDFSSYIALLKNPTESMLRLNFEKKFDHDILPQIQ